MTYEIFKELPKLVPQADRAFGVLDDATLKSVEILDPNQEPVKEARPLLDGLWGRAAAVSLMISKECPVYPEIACGSASVNPSKRLRELFSLSEKVEDFTTTIVLDESEKPGARKAQVIARANNVLVAFSVESENNGDGYRRLLRQTILKGEEVSVFEIQDEKGPIWKDYLAVIEVIRQVRQWRKSEVCVSCPVQKLDVSLNGPAL
jgi:hypothetical protein